MCFKEVLSSILLVILPMEKYQRLFSKNNKDGVAQFWDFRQNEKRGPEAADPIVFDVTVKYMK